MYPFRDFSHLGLMKDADKLKLMLLAWNYQNSTAGMFWIYRNCHTYSAKPYKCLSFIVHSSAKWYRSTRFKYGWQSMDAIPKCFSQWRRKITVVVSTTIRPTVKLTEWWQSGRKQLIGTKRRRWWLRRWFRWQAWSKYSWPGALESVQRKFI